MFNILKQNWFSSNLMLCYYWLHILHNFSLRKAISTRYIEKLLFLILISILMMSCDSKRVFEDNIAIPNHSWSSDYPASFKIDIHDTLSAHNLYINLRNTKNYKYQNIYFFFKTLFPNGNMTTDTIECFLANDQGKWLGKGGDIVTNRILFKRKVIFQEAGVYSFEINQAMREKSLDEILDVGLRLEKSK